MTNPSKPIWPKGQRKRFFLALRNLPVILACLGVSLSLEAFAALGIVSQGDGVTRYFEAALCLFCGLAALAVSSAAADLKIDPRPEIRRTAFPARAVSLLLLIPSSYYVGNSFAYEGQRIAAIEFRASDEFIAAQSALATAQTTREKLEAGAELARGTIPRRATFDPLSMMWAAFFLVMNALAIGLGRKPKPETEAEAKRRRKAVAVAKAKRTRQANEAKLKGPRLVASR